MLEVVDKDSLPCSSLPDPPSTFSGKRGHATTDTQRRPSFARSARTDEGQDVSFRRRAPAEPAVVGQTEVSQDAVQRHRDVAVIEDSNRRRRKGSGEEARRKDREVAATEAPVENTQRDHATKQPSARRSGRHASHSPTRSSSDSPAVTSSANTNAAMEEEQEEEAVEEKEDASVEPAHNIKSTPVRDQLQPPTSPLFTIEQQQPPEHEAPLVQPEDVPLAPVDKPQTPIATSEEVAMSDEVATTVNGIPDATPPSSSSPPPSYFLTPSFDDGPSFVEALYSEDNLKLVQNIKAIPWVRVVPKNSSI